MSTAPVDVFLASFKRCQATPDFLRRFYDLFMEASPEIREKFRNTDFPRQTRVLADSLYVLAVAAQGRPDSPAWGELPRLAERHDRAHLDVRPEFYDTWLDCIVKAAAEHDAQFSPEVEAAWRETLRVGIEYMRSRH